MKIYQKIRKSLDAFELEIKTKVPRSKKEKAYKKQKKKEISFFQFLFFIKTYNNYAHKKYCPYKSNHLSEYSHKKHSTRQELSDTKNISKKCVGFEIGFCKKRAHPHPFFCDVFVSKIKKIYTYGGPDKERCHLTYFSYVWEYVLHIKTYYTYNDQRQDKFFCYSR